MPTTLSGFFSKSPTLLSPICDKICAMASANGKDIITTDLASGWVVSTGKFGSINTGLNLTGIAASAIKGANSLVQRKGYRVEMEIWRPATVGLCAVHTSNIPLDEEAVSHLSTMVEKRSKANTKTLGSMVTLSLLTYLQQWLDFQQTWRAICRIGSHDSGYV